MTTTGKSTSGRKVGPVLGAVKTGLRLVDAVSADMAGTVAERLFVTTRWASGAEPMHAPSGAQPWPLQLDGQTLTGWTWGSGPAVLLVHGWQGRAAQLDALVDPLVRAGLRVVAFDAPGHGTSPGSIATLDLFARAVAAAEAYAGGLRAIVAHSFGAAAVTVALARGVQAERVVYVAPLVDVRRAVDKFVRVAELSEPAAAAFRQRLAERNGIAMEALEGKRVAGMMTGRLLVVHDPGDRETPFEDSVGLVAAWPRARLVGLPGTGHRRILGAPVAVEEITAHILDRPASVKAAGVTEAEELDAELWDPELRMKRALAH